VKQARGYTLLEALVALVIFGTSGVALITLLMQGFETSRRVVDAERRARLQLDALAQVPLINPSLAPEGSVQADDFELRWQSKLVEPPRTEFAYGGLVPAKWVLGLYEVEFNARRGETSARWSQQVVGWKEAPSAGQPTNPRLQ